jgi:hypothetical protein
MHKRQYPIPGYTPVLPYHSNGNNEKRGISGIDLAGNSFHNEYTNSSSCAFYGIHDGNEIRSIQYCYKLCLVQATTVARRIFVIPVSD